MICYSKPWLIIDVVLYLILLGLGLSLGSMSLVTPMMAPISCSDPALQRPLLPDTLTIELVIVLCTVLPAIAIFLMELILAARRQTTSTVFRRTMPLVWDLLVGELFAFCLMELLKITTGMPRPHFWESCGLDTKEYLCEKRENGTTISRGSVIVDLFNCSNPKLLPWRHLADAAKSFPSGHSCLAVFSTVYMTAYIYQRLRPRDSNDTVGGGYQKVARKWLPFPWFVMTCLVATSRLWDQRHHWWDLVGGGILGAIVAVLTVTVIGGAFHRVSEWTPLEGSKAMRLTTLNGRNSSEPSTP